MIRKSKFVAGILVFVLSFSNLVNAATIPNSNAIGKKESKAKSKIVSDEDYRKQKIEEIQSLLKHKKTKVQADADHINELNNNIISSNVQTVNPEASTGRVDKSTAIQSQAVTKQAMSATSDPPAVEEKPFASPFDIKNNGNENVTLNTGALNYEYTIASFPGANGLDLNIKLRYNSLEAATTTEEYGSTDQVTNNGFICKGWSLGFSAIQITTRQDGGQYKKVLKLSDGRSYQIIDNISYGVGECTILGDRLKDMKLTKDNNTKEYTLEYKDGGQEIFDINDGYLKMIKDRYGDCISFQYITKTFYTLTKDYSGATVTLTKTVKLLSDIGHTTNRAIHVDYNITDTGSYNYVSTIGFGFYDIYDAPIYKTIGIKNVESQLGRVNLLDYIIDEENQKTSFEYPDKEMIGVLLIDGFPYRTDSSCFPLQAITYPTGGSTVYSYEKCLRSYCQYTDYAYEVYRIKTREDRINEISVNKVSYDYELDYSGYPKSYLDSEGNIEDGREYYVTVEKYADPDVEYHDGKKTVYTFNSKHLMIEEEVTENGSNLNRQDTICIYSPQTKLLTSKQTFIYGENGQKRTFEESYEYDNNTTDPTQMYGDLTKFTDRVGHITEYKYYTDRYHLPMEVVKYKGTPNEQKTSYDPGTVYDKNTTNGKNINQIVQYYKNNKEIITNLYYEGWNPGNLTEEIKIERNNGTNTLISSIAYGYEDGVHVTSKTVQNADVYDDSFNDVTKNITHCYGYDAFGLLSSETDELGRTTNYWYYKNGWPQKVVYPDGTYKSMVYTVKNGSIPSDRNTITTDYNGKYTTIDVYDDLGRLTDKQEVKPDGSINTLLTRDYDISGHVWYEEDAAGNVNEYLYDAFDRLSTTLSESLECDEDEYFYTAIDYDDYNMVKMTYNGTRKACRDYYDLQGRTIKKETPSQVQDQFYATEYIYADDSRYQTYNPGSNPELDDLLMIDANGHKTNYKYDDLGRLRYVVTDKVTDGVKETTEYNYDKQGNLNYIKTPKGSEIKKTYDDLGRLKELIYPRESGEPDGKSEYYVYDDAGNPIKYMDKNGQTTTLSYKPNTNLVEKKTVGSIAITYGYDDFKNVTSIFDGKEIINYGYYYNQKLDTITMPDNKTIKYTYYDNGSIWKVKDYQNNTTEYDYNSLGEIRHMRKNSNNIAEYQYNTDGTKSALIYPDKGRAEYQYYDNKWLKELKNYRQNGDNETLINQYTYQYDKVGNQAQKTELAGSNTKTSTYQYDELNRIDIVTEDGCNTDYTYDSNSNISSIVKTGAENYVINNIYDFNNHLKKQTKAINGIDEVTDFSYDNNGNLILKEKSIIQPSNTSNTETIQLGILGESTNQQLKETASYEYNELNQLVQYCDLNGTSAAYAYYGDGTRKSKAIEGGVTTNYYYDRGYIINETTNGANSAVNIIGAGEIVGRSLADGRNACYIKNGHGDTVKLLADDGSIIANYDNDIWGNSTQADGTFDNPFRYCGEYFDKETATYYLRARNYDPSIGRFTTEDSVRSQQIELPNKQKVDDPLSLNLYTYCYNNPINLVDPSGHYAGDPFDTMDAAAADFDSIYGYLSPAINAEDATYIYVEDGKYKYASPHVIGETSGSLGSPASYGIDTTYVVIVAAIHTHGTYEKESDNRFSIVEDGGVNSDLGSSVSGYSTYQGLYLVAPNGTLQFWPAYRDKESTPRLDQLIRVISTSMPKQNESPAYTAGSEQLYYEIEKPWDFYFNPANWGKNLYQAKDKGGTLTAK